MNHDARTPDRGFAGLPEKDQASTPLPEGPKTHPPVGGGLEGEGGGPAGKSWTVAVCPTHGPVTTVHNVAGYTENADTGPPICIHCSGPVEMVEVAAVAGSEANGSLSAPSFEGEREEQDGLCDLAFWKDVRTILPEGVDDEAGSVSRAIAEQAYDFYVVARRAHPNTFAGEREGATPDEGAGKNFLALVAQEIAAARSKFPGNRHMYVALAEEVGEVARSLLEGADNLYDECVQVAAMAMRLAEEGDSDFPSPWSVAEAQPKAQTEGGQPAVGNDELRMWEAWACPVCHLLDAMPDPNGKNPVSNSECAGVKVIGTDHEPCARERVIVAEHRDVDAAMAASREALSPVLYDELREAVAEAEDLLRRLSEWDVLYVNPVGGPGQGDAAYWQAQIATVRNALAVAAKRPCSPAPIPKEER